MCMRKNIERQVRRGVCDVHGDINQPAVDNTTEVA